MLTNLKTLHSKLENKDDDKICTKHCLSTRSQGEFARVQYIKDIVFLIYEQNKSSLGLYAGF